MIENIYLYENYRTFLADYFEMKKTIRKTYTYRYFAKKAGFGGHSFCSRIIKGERNLSNDSLQKMIRGLDLKGQEASYFEALVYYNQSMDDKTKNFYYDKLEEIRKTTEYYQLKHDEYRYAEVWYYQIIRELVVKADWNDDYALLASMVRPAIRVEDAKTAVAYLLEKDFLAKKDGSYRFKDDFINTKDVPSFIRQTCRDDVLKNGADAAKHLLPTQRYTAFGTISIDKKDYDAALEILNNAAMEVMKLSAGKKEDIEVHQFVLQMFPASQIHSIHKGNET